MLLGLACALVAAVCYGFGSVAQAMAAADTATRGRLNVAMLARLVSHWRYVAGLALDLLGFVAAIVALRKLPLFVVQAAVASSVGITAVAAQQLLGVRLERRERVALVVLATGLVLLGIAGQPERASHLGAPGPALVLGSAALVALAAATWSRSGVKLAAAAGASFGAVGIAARAIEVPHPWGDVVRDPLAYAIVIHGVLAVALFAAALQRGTVTTVAATTFAVETVVPAFVGLTVLGDHARSGLLPVAVTGFGLTLAAAIALARHANPSVEQHDHTANHLANESDGPSVSNDLGDLGPES